jgi:soluble lytic murein transglycosylase-like protein
MSSAADTLVTKYKSREAQLRSPVYEYLKPLAPFDGTDQDLYMSVFYPKARKWNKEQEFPDSVKRVNPGIVYVGDYVSKVNKLKATATLTPQEWTALKDTANKLGLKWESLYKLINFESGWNPAARNPYSGARGLIQFMPSTAMGMGYKGAIDIAAILLAVGVVYFLMKRGGYL